MMEGLGQFDAHRFFELLIRLGLNIVVLILLVGWLYYGKTKRKDFLFSYFLIGTIIFLLCFMLSSLNLKIGFTLGMFAVFGIIRYRTDAIPIKEMTYLFIVIGLSIINSLSNDILSFYEIIATNVIILLITFGFEKIWLQKNESVKRIRYEKIELIRPENRALLIEDLKQRTGITNIRRVEIGKIDFLRDTATVIIYYYEKEGSNFADYLDSRSNVDDDED